MIEFDRVGFSYGKTPILEDVSQSLAPGSFHFLTGPSGAGKSTLLKLCYLALRPTGGRATLFGQDAGRAGRDAVARLRRKIGVIHQDCQFLDHLNLWENVAMPLRLAGRDVRAFERDIADLMEWVGLTGREKSFPPELSGGERQRLAVARAVILAPDMIIADEPTGNVDWNMARRLLTLMIELNKLGKTILIATHDLNLIRHAKTEVSARVLRLRDRGLQLAGADL